MDNETARNRAILLFEYGSRAHGTDTVDSDSDFMGISVEPVEYVLGLKSWDSSIMNTAANNVRSAASDVDTTIYSLKKWAALAAKGNPTVLTALFAPKYEVMTTMGRVILDNGDLFIHKEAGYRFAGYMHSQREALLGKRNKRTNRPELVHKHGYDTKFAYHMMRLGLQGQELMKTGRLELPMREGEREYLRSIRNGEVNKTQLLKFSDVVERNLVEAIEKSHLPEHADMDSINKMLEYIYVQTWKEDKHVAERTA